MNKQKAPLYILILVVIIFIVAILFKSFQVSNVEVVNYDVMEKIKTQEPKKIPSSIQSTPRLTNKNDTVAEDDFEKLTFEQKQRTISRLQTLIAFHPTAESMYLGIVDAQEQGNEQKERDLISLLAKIYPESELIE
ncbi:MAG: hypothetical protein L3J83_06205 [Proteobacteria bacterium]|nr:hypothetical protein [Pseudomonadota bacterium]